MIRPTATARPRWIGLLLFVLVVSSLSRVVWADPAGPTSMDHNVTIAVTRLLDQQHLSQHPLNDEISQRGLKSFLKMLDPMKVYFYQSDVDHFERSGNQLDDMARRGDVQFAYDVFQTFLQRVDERVKLVDEALAMKHDFTVDEQMVIDRDAAHYAKNPAEAWDRWRKRIKYDLLVLKADDDDKIEGQKSRSTNSSDATTASPSGCTRPSNADLLEMYLTSFTTAYDPHTSYMSNEPRSTTSISPCV